MGSVCGAAVYCNALVHELVEMIYKSIETNARVGHQVAR